jgi:hypothetical protein
VRTGLILKLLEQTHLDIVLRDADLTTEEVVITGAKGDLLSTQEPGASVHVSLAQLEALPLPSASFEEAGRLSPYMVEGSALGLNRIYNDVSVDGLGFGDHYGLQHVEADISGMYDNPLTLESIQEIRVDVAPFDVRRSGFTGAAVTAVTRGGTSRLSGSINATTTPGWWIGRNPDDGRPDAHGFTDGRASFRIGGPLTESKSFYFVAGEITHMRMPIERRFGAQTTKGTTFSFSPGTTMQLSSMLFTAHGYDPGRFDVVNVERNSATLFTRFDFELSPDHRLSARYNFRSAESDRPPYGTTVFASGSLARNTNREHSIIVEFNSVFGPSIANEFLLGYSSRQFASTPQAAPFPFVDVIVVDRLNWWNHLTAGSELGGKGDRVVQEHLEIRNTTSVSAGSHLLAFGVQAEMHWFETSLLANQWGSYTFSSYQAFERRQTQTYELRYLRDTLSRMAPQWRAIQASGYVQDEWKVSPTVSISAGVRIDVPVFPDRPAENSAVRDAFSSLGYDISTSRVPRARAMVSPRFGITIVPKPDRSIQVRGGIGVFTGHFPYAWLGNLYDHTGLDAVHVKKTSLAPTFVANPYAQPRPGSSQETSEILVLGKDFVLPQVLRLTVALDHTFPWNTVGSLEAVYSVMNNGIVFKNINLKPSGNLNPEWSGDARELYTTHSSKFTNVMYMTNGETGTSTFLTARLQRIPGDDGVFASLAYTIGQTKDVNSGAWDNPYDQWRYNPAVQPNEPRMDYSSFDRSTRIVASLAYQWELLPGHTTSISFIYNGASGMPFSYVYDGDMNGDGETLNDLFYVPGAGAEIYLVNEVGGVYYPTDQHYRELFNFLRRDEYLSSHRGRYAERNGARAPWTHQFDLRIGQTVPLATGHRLEFQAEILNVLNLLNAEWGIVEYVPYGIVPILQLYKRDEIGRPWFRWSPRTTPLVAEPLLSRWRLRIGARYSF